MIVQEDGPPRAGTDAPTAVDMFCGAGGLSLGLSAAGFNCIRAFDIDTPSTTTYKSNLGNHAQVADARDVKSSDFAIPTSSPRSELDLLAGGPPCQGFSKQKRGAHLGDPRNELVLEHLRLIQESHPRAFLMENVAMLAGVRGAHLVERFNALADYELVGHFYLAADYGVAQTRERFVLVGIRRDQPGSFFVPPPSSRPWPTVGDALQGLPSPPSNGDPHPTVANHQASKMNKLNQERFSYVPQGGGWQDIPFEKRLKCHQVVNTKKGGWPDVYGRLRLDGQAPTITGGFDSVSRGRYGHPIENRAITPREAARLQGFPDWFVFHGNRHEVRHQIGNAVPAPLGMEIGKSILAALNGNSERREREAVQLGLFGGK